MPIILPYIEDRPRLTLQLFSKRGKRWRVFSALIDSGADFSIFPSIAAEVLGIKFHHSKKTDMESADGDTFAVYKVNVPAQFENRRFVLPIGFSTKADIFPLLGRRGFFEAFMVEFDERAKETILRPYK